MDDELQKLEQFIARQLLALNVTVRFVNLIVGDTKILDKVRASLDDLKQSYAIFLGSSFITSDDLALSQLDQELEEKKIVVLDFRATGFDPISYNRLLNWKHRYSSSTYMGAIFLLLHQSQLTTETEMQLQKIVDFRFYE